MTLTITHQETIRLAQELADLTGETPAAAIALALKDRLLLEREEREWEEARRARMAIPEFGYGLGIGIAARRARMAIPLEERLAEVRAIVKRFNEDLPPGPSAVEHGDVLYDENGLPK